MSYTIVDDQGVIQVRASITTIKEMSALIEQLDRARDVMTIKQEKTNDRDHPEPVRPLQAE